MNLNIKNRALNIGKLIQASSPTILTGLGVVGVVGTAVLVAKASYEARDRIVAREDEVGIVKGGATQLPAKQKAELIWKLYIPAVGVGSLTIVAIIASNRIHARRLAALAAGYALLSKDFDDYRDQAFEKLGIKKNDELNKEHAKKKLEATPMAYGAVLPDGKTWFCDMSTMRYFPSTMESVKWAVNNVNHKLNNQGDFSLNNFYEELDLEVTEGIGDMLGWSPGMKVEIVPIPMLTDQYGAVTAFKFAAGALPKYIKRK